MASGLTDPRIIEYHGSPNRLKEMANFQELLPQFPDWLILKPVISDFLASLSLKKQTKYSTSRGQ